MRPFDDIPLEEGDYSDVALLLAGAREWPSDDFARELDARVARRFAPEGAAQRSARGGRLSLPRWAAGPAVAVVAGAVAAVVVLSGGGINGTINGATGSFGSGSSGNVSSGNGSSGNGSSGNGSSGNGLKRLAASQAAKEQPVVGLATHAKSNPARSSGGAGALTQASGGFPESAPKLGPSVSSAPGSAAGSANSGTVYGPATASKTLNATSQAANTNAPAVNATPQAVNATSAAPIAPGSKQIQSAQLSLTTANQHVDQVAQEVFTVVGAEHGIVQSSHITAATRDSGGGYAAFSLSIPTGNLQDAMTQLSRLRYASVYSRTDASQNVSDQYNRDQRQLADAKALRASLLKQLQTAYTQSAIDSIKAQLKLAEEQIANWQATLDALQHRISYSDVTVQINAGGPPVLPAPRHTSTGFTIGRAGHDALRVLVVSAGIALIALAVMLPLGLVAALLMWLWVWLRQRRREHALDATG